MIGVDNGYVRVISFAGLKKQKDGKNKRIWDCECRCGKFIVLETSQINVGIPRGCCYKQSRPGNKVNHSYLLKHGLNKRQKRHPVYRLWLNIKSRCYKVSNKDYTRYGGRGIFMLDEWRYDSKLF
ncbi:MAG: hypothetical protein ACRDL7_03535, partial [Gaiellaceae bacterium]